MTTELLACLLCFLHPAAAPPHPDDIDPNAWPAEYRKSGQDWTAFFNPNVPRVLDVGLQFTFGHERCVSLGLACRDVVWLIPVQCRLLRQVLRRRAVPCDRLQPRGAYIRHADRRKDTVRVVPHAM